MKYTVSLPETEAQLAEVDHLETSAGTTWKLERPGNGKQAVHLDLSNVEVTLQEGNLSIFDSKSGTRQVFPVVQIHADGSVMVATALGNFRVLASRGAASTVAKAGRRGQRALKSSMPGKVLKILCAKGDAIEQGQPLLIIEAMKMENEIRSPQAGIVEEIPVQVGQKIETGELLVKIGAPV
ncbi:MAG: acetyl-CoA carboxylase biotin carboxyl carrier protein subunit [Bdellovibrionota bacterium]